MTVIVLAVLLQIVTLPGYPSPMFVETGNVTEMKMEDCLASAREVNYGDTHYLLVCVPERDKPIEG